MFSRIVPTIEATTIRPIGTKTVTLSDRQVSVAGSRSTPSFESASAPMPRMARTSAAPSRTFPAISTLEGIPGGVAPESSLSRVLIVLAHLVYVGKRLGVTPQPSASRVARRSLRSRRSSRRRRSGHVRRRSEPSMQPVTRTACDASRWLTTRLARADVADSWSSSAQTEGL
jgi:hypothetical protein